MNIYDVELIESWTPKQLFLFIKAKQKQRVDDMNYQVKALFIERYVMNAKKPKPDKAFNADQEIQHIEDQFNQEERDKRQQEKEERVKRQESILRRLRGGKGKPKGR